MLFPEQDKVLHLIVGVAIYLTCKKLNISDIKAIMLVFIAAVLKEIVDTTVYSSPLLEHIKDILSTILAPIILIGINKIYEQKRNRVHKEID